MNSIFTSARYTGQGALNALRSVFLSAMPATRILVVADDTTWAAAREGVESQLVNGPDYAVHSLGPRVRASKSIADELAILAVNYDAILAVGSGTINDLCKYAAFTASKPYAVVATAASMNGYSSANASLELDGFKQSFTARPPVAVVADSAILVAAPKRLTRAGIGDTLCRSTVEADILLSHLLFDTPYPQEVFKKLQKHEPTLLTGLMNARDGEETYIECLMTALLDAGDAMTVQGSSAVASQGEHMIAHTLELKYGMELLHVLHGELIAITALTMSQLQHRMLLIKPLVRRMDYLSEQFAQQFGKRHAQSLSEAYGRKCLDDAQVEVVNRRIANHWPDMATQINKVIINTNTLERAFIHSGINTTPAQIGLAEERYRFATSYAHLTRDRFTFLDLAAMNVKRVN